MIREAFEARDQIITHLSIYGFSDIDEEDLVIFLAAKENLTTEIIAGLASDFGVTGQAVGRSFTKLLSRGYLELRKGPGKSERPRIAITRRGLSMLYVIWYVVGVRRWADFPVRQGDIVISTVPKSGTTWLQMICALLIFQSPDFPAPLQQLSPWLEWPKYARDDVFAELAAQRHRRFIKTHARLGEISFDSRVTYLVVGRHPLDVALSFLNAYSAPRYGDNGDPAVNTALAPCDMLPTWIDVENPFERAGSLAGVMEFLSDAWQYRNEPNVLFLHYEQLSEDLEGEMRRLADSLGISVPGTAWPGLVKAATFEKMRASADRLQPLPDLMDPAAFFHSGQSGRGRELLTGQTLAHYHEQIAQLAPSDLVAWLHRERDSA
jgi:aryl sulfotransferase